MNKNTPYWLAFNRTSGLGPVTARRLWMKVPDLSQLFLMSDEEWRILGLSERMRHVLRTVDLSVVDEDEQWLQGSSHRAILTLEDPGYPSLLKEIHDPPIVLYVEGQQACLNNLKLSMVGTRRPTRQGEDIAFQFSQRLASLGIVIVSGLALGIDAASHRGCLEAGGATIAVMGTGMDLIYPRQHRSLAEHIQENGLILSEFPLKSPPVAGHFPRRNRIISGLSLALLVVESAVPSGSLLTARFALEQNREVMAIPGSIRNTKVDGCHFLLRQGATLVTSPEDVLDVFSIEKASTAEQSKTWTDGMVVLLSCIKDEVMTVDQLVIQSGQSVEDVMCGLIDLEIEGLVRSLSGGYVRCVL